MAIISLSTSLTYFSLDQVSRPDLEFTIGDTVDVKYMGFDRRINRLKFSRKAALPLPFRDNNSQYQGGIVYV